MKAVIMEINSVKTTILTNNGQFLEIRTKHGYKVGSEINYIPISLADSIYKYASIAAVFLIFVSIGIFLYTFNTPYGYIDVEVNPAISITTNRYNYIIDITGLNDDGEKIIENDSIKNKSLDTGLPILINTLEDQYLTDGEEKTLVFSITADTDNKYEYYENLIAKLIYNRKENVEFYTIRATLKEYREAQNNNMSSGRLTMIRELQESDKSITLDDLKDVSIRDVIKQLKEAESNRDEAEKSRWQTWEDRKKAIEERFKESSNNREEITD